MSAKKIAMISQPMNGFSEEEIKETRENAIEYLESYGYEVKDTYFDEEWANADNMKERGIKNIPVAFLGKSLEGMSHCDVIYFCKGWHKARGCKIEHEVAKKYKIGIIYEDPDDLDREINKDMNDKYEELLNKLKMHQELMEQHKEEILQMINDSIH